MIRNYPLSIQGRITQASVSEKINAEAPQTDRVLDLAQSKGLESELNAHNAENTDYIRLNQNTAISVKELSSEELTTLIDSLKSRALDKNFKLRAGLAPENLISVQDNTVTLSGTEPVQVLDPETSPIAQAEAVIHKSNSNTDDAYWSFSNGTSHSLTFQKASEKPAPWNNHMCMSDDKAFIYQTEKDTRVTALPGEKTLKLSVKEAQNMGLPEELIKQVKQKGELRYLPKEGYQAMLKNDFNFNGAFEAFQSTEQFTAALKATYPDRAEALGEANFKELGNRIYAYASRGQDADGTIDVQDMQGLLYALDPEIRLSSNSNTPMQAQNLFQMDQATYEVLPESEKLNYVAAAESSYVPLSITQEEYQSLSPENKVAFTSLGDRFVPQGDNKHGRATTLTTRHIMEKISQNEIPQEPTSFTFTDDVSSLFGPNDRFIRDASGSMGTKWGALYRGVDEALKTQGILQQNESLNDRIDLSINQNGSLKAKGQQIQINRSSGPDFNPQTKALGIMLQDAYDTYQKPGETGSQNRSGFATLVGLPEAELFDPDGTIKNSDIKLTQSFDKLLHQEGRLKPNQSLKRNMSALISSDGTLKFAAGKTYKPTVATIESEKFDRHVKDFSNVLSDAYTTFASSEKSADENQKAFAELLGLPSQQIFDNRGNLKGDDVMDLLGDNRGSLFNRSVGATGEAAFKGVITSLLYDTDYAPGNRMNVLVDEALQDMEYLALAQALATAKGVDVRFIAAPTNIRLMDTNATLDDLKNSPEKFINFIDMQSMCIAYDEQNNPVSMDFTAQSIDENGKLQESNIYDSPLLYFKGEVHGSKVDYTANPDGFKGSYLSLQGINQGGYTINGIRDGNE